ncbi:formate/nitrite transporter family protein [Corynebacterium diphtheriae]
MGQAVEKHAEGLGAPVFLLFFGLGLFAIVILGAELATGSMMYVVYGAINKQVGWGKGPVVAHRDHVLQPRRCGSLRSGNGHVCEAGPYRPDPPHFHLAHGKLEKDPAGLLVEGMLANFVVNMAIIGAVFAKEIVSKFFVIVPIIACFVGLSLEHVIANFCLMTLTFFCFTPLPDGFTLGAVLTNWSLVWIGNVIGGGFLIGGVYAWLNKDPEVYRD